MLITNQIGPIHQALAGALVGASLFSVSYARWQRALALPELRLGPGDG